MPVSLSKIYTLFPTAEGKLSPFPPLLYRWLLNRPSSLPRHSGVLLVRNVHVVTLLTGTRKHSLGSLTHWSADLSHPHALVSGALSYAHTNLLTNTHSQTGLAFRSCLQILCAAAHLPRVYRHTPNPFTHPMACPDLLCSQPGSGVLCFGFVLA